MHVGRFALDAIYQGDSVALLDELPNESVDLVIADPPYSIAKDFGCGTASTDLDEWLLWTKQWLSKCPRVMKPGASIFVYGIHHSISYVQCYLYELQLHYGRMLIWHYENGWSKYERGPASTYEPLLWFYKDGKPTYHKMREPYASQERLQYKINKNGRTWTPHPEGRHAGDVWRIPTLAGRRFADEKVDHPTQKPLPLCDRIVRHFSNPGDLVLVPFAGSGSECVSALKNGRHFVGFEINPDYTMLARHRVEDSQVLLPVTSPASA